jgi:hypothetical protein
MQEDKPMLFGEPYSVYVRAVRLALEEKNGAYELVPVDIFKPGGPPPEHYARHPFGKIPAFEHAGFPSTKRVRSPDTWRRRFRGLGSNLDIPVPACG